MERSVSEKLSEKQKKNTERSVSEKFLSEKQKKNTERSVSEKFLSEKQKKNTERSVSEKFLCDNQKKNSERSVSEKFLCDNQKKNTERSVSEKFLSKKQKKKNGETQNAKKNRFLITVNVLGSAGPLRFVVKEEDSVGAIIDKALKLYSREGRLPILGFGSTNFLLYQANAVSDALNPSESIGSSGGRNFLLCKKQKQPQMTEGRSEMISRKGSGSWKAWINKSFSFKISSH